MNDSPLTPRASPSDSRIVEDCPTCRRVIWSGTRCHHGLVDLTPTGNNEDALVVTPGAEAPLKGKKGGRS